MKEGINLAPLPPTPESEEISKAAALGNLPHRLRVINAVLILIIVLISVGNLALTTARQRAEEDQRKLETRLTEVSEKKKAVESLIKRQEDLKYLKSTRINYKRYVDAVKENVPQDVILSSLTVTSSQTVISARAKNSLSFSILINGLAAAKDFSEISLTNSAYQESSNEFSFTLVCQNSIEKK